jgi:hypothetical protein
MTTWTSARCIGAGSGAEIGSGSSACIRVTPRSVKRWVPLLLIAFASNGCGGAGQQPADGGCAKAIIWNGTRYAADSRVESSHGRKLGNGRSACRDEQEVEVVRLHRVRPAVAVGVSGAAGAYLADGFLPALGSHPLHEAVYGGARAPTGPRKRCREPFDWSAKVLHTPDQGAELNLLRVSDNSEQIAHLHSRTRVRGFLRSGLPYVQRNDLIRISGIVCHPAQNAVFRTELIRPAR